MNKLKIAFAMLAATACHNVFATVNSVAVPGSDVNSASLVCHDDGGKSFEVSPIRNVTISTNDDGRPVAFTFVKVGKKNQPGGIYLGEGASCLFMFW